MNREQGLKEIERTRIVAIVRGVHEATSYLLLMPFLKAALPSWKSHSIPQVH